MSKKDTAVLLMGALIFGALITLIFVSLRNSSNISDLSSQLQETEQTLDTIELQESFLVNEEVDTSTIQAVFLANEQVYFGRLSDGAPGQVKLENIYYLQATNGEVPDIQKVEDLEDLNTEVSLVKLGDELHGPKDVMYITRDQVLFWENLKQDSDVVKAIADYESSL